MEFAGSVISPDSSERASAIREKLYGALLGQLTDALLACPDLDVLESPVLRVEASIHEHQSEQQLECQSGSNQPNNGAGALPPPKQIILSQSLDLSAIVPLSISRRHRHQGLTNDHHPDALASPRSGHTGDGVPGSRNRDSTPTEDTTTATPAPRATLGSLRPPRKQPRTEDDEDTHRQIRVADDRSFPKRAKPQPPVPVPQESSLGKLVISIWEQIHGGLSFEPRSLIEQWRLTAALTTSTLDRTGRPAPANQAPPTPPATDDAASSRGDTPEAFSHNSILCRKITHASRTCRSVEVIVQARWVEHFDAHVAFLAATTPDTSTTKCRKAALAAACGHFSWSEKEMRNKMAIWRGYKEIKDAGGWPALVFAGMGLYRFCKYRAGFDDEGLRRLRALRARFEVAADTLHPQWRQLLAVVGEGEARARFGGHAHDWVVWLDGSEPVTLASTFFDIDPGFHFEHIDESVINTSAWGADDPRWTPPPPNPNVAQPTAYLCATCRMEQSDDRSRNSCYCFPALFGGPRYEPAGVQIFHTTTGKRNGVLALVPFPRGAAIGEFVGLVTRGVEGSDVMVSSVGGRTYQICQRTRGNFTRFVNHSCKANAQFERFVWRGTERILLVSKGVGAGLEVTVDYSKSYWRGLEKSCLCGEACCRYNGARGQQGAGGLAGK